MSESCISHNETATVSECCVSHDETATMGECCVCYDETATVSKCGHYTCYNCVSKLTSSECPICRRSLVFDDLNIKFRGVFFDKLYFDDGNIYKDEEHLSVFRPHHKSSGLRLNDTRTGFVFTSDGKYKVTVNTKDKNNLVKMRLYGNHIRKYTSNEVTIHAKKFGQLFISVPLRSWHCAEVTFQKL